MKLISLSERRQTAAEILAAAVLELCPDALIIEGRDTFSGFAYHFIFPSPFSEEILPYIEDRMNKIISDDLPITHQEMIPENASEFFRQYPRYYPSLYAKQHAGPLVDIFKMGNFVDLCPGPYARSTGEIGIVKLIGSSQRPSIRYRGEKKPVLSLYGVISETKQQLKESLKNKKEFFETEHRHYGTVHSLFLIKMERGKHLHEIHRCYWLAEGERLKETLYLYWRKSHEEKGFDVIQTQGNNLVKNHEELFILTGKNLKKGSWKVAEYSRVASDEGIDPWKGFFESKDYYFDLAHIFCLKADLNEELISCLQFFKKTFKIFSFNIAIEIFMPKKNKELYQHLTNACEVLGFKGEEKSGNLAKVIWKITDRYGVQKSGPFIELRTIEKDFIITYSIFNRLEQFIALMMEAKGASFQKRVKDIAKKRNIE